MTQPIPVAPGVIADVSVLVLSVNEGTQQASIRVIDNNGGFLTVAVSLPLGVIKPKSFQVVVGDVLESTDGKQITGLVRWTDGLMWSPSPSGVPANQTTGWRKLGNFVIP
jgi:hypothetical protein